MRTSLNSLQAYKYHEVHKGRSILGLSSGVMPGLPYWCTCNSGVLVYSDKGFWIIPGPPMYSCVHVLGYMYSDRGVT